MIKIIAVLCSLSSPANCHEQTVTTSDFAELSMQSCLMGAPQLAEWMKQHPAAPSDNDRDSVGGSGIPEVTFRPLPFAEHRTFAKRSHVKDRKGFDMTYFGSTRVVDQASAHSLPRVFTIAGRHIALNPTDSTETEVRRAVVLPK